MKRQRRISARVGDDVFMGGSPAEFARWINSVNVNAEHTRKVEELMSTVQAVIDRVAAVKAEITEARTVMSGVVTLLNGLSAIIASLRQQLADAIANGADPATLQGIVDQLAEAETQLDAGGNELAAAAVANTPAQEPV